MSATQSEMRVVTKPNVEFLLKQVFSVYKEEIGSLTNKLSEAKAENKKKSPCSFCAVLREQVNELQSQVTKLMQDECQKLSANTKDISIQTDLPLILASPSKNSSKRTILFSPPRKRPHFQTKSPANSDENREDVILAPSTPERDPQRYSRVKRWLQTLEVPETVDVGLLQEEDAFSPSLIGADDSKINKKPAKGSPEKNIDMDATMLPLSCPPKNFCAPQVASRKEQASENEIEKSSETVDMDATMIPLGYLNPKVQPVQSVFIKTEPDEHSNASTEDFLVNPALLKNPRHGATNLNVLTDMANMTDEKLIAHPRPPKSLPYKYKEDPVRKRADRKQLPGNECADCALYYAGANGQQRKNICSKHRATHVAPATPEHFWELDFPDSQVCRERGYLDVTQKIKLQSRRLRPLKPFDEKV